MMTEETFMASSLMPGRLQDRERGLQVFMEMNPMSSGAILGAMAARKPPRRRRDYAPFTIRAIDAIRSIPRGAVATYGQVAGAAGSPLAARQVARLLHSLSVVERLPWHRVVGSGGRIRLPRGAGFEKQRSLLRAEGVGVSADGLVSLARHPWKPRLG
jgi:methylated-DNA-protein-cysteine methyltransferase related protein